MEVQGFFDPDGFGLRLENIYFEPTREAKVARIAELACQIFIDDLDEVLCDPFFPAGCRRMHLAGNAAGPTHDGVVRCSEWGEVMDAVFG